MSDALDGGRHQVITWDYREQPPWERVAVALRVGLVHLTEVEDTGSDQYAVVLADHVCPFVHAVYARWATTSDPENGSVEGHG